MRLLVATIVVYLHTNTLLTTCLLGELVGN